MDKKKNYSFLPNLFGQDGKILAWVLLLLLLF